MTDGEDDGETTQRLRAQETRVMAVLTEIRQDGKEVKTIVRQNQIEIVEVKGKIDLNAQRIEQNTKDLDRDDGRIGTLEKRINGLAVKVASAASATGAAAGAAASALINLVNKGGG